MGTSCAVVTTQICASDPLGGESGYQASEAQERWGSASLSGAILSAEGNAWIAENLQEIVSVSKIKGRVTTGLEAYSVQPGYGNGKIL